MHRQSTLLDQLEHLRRHAGHVKLYCRLDWRRVDLQADQEDVQAFATFVPALEQGLVLVRIQADIHVRGAVLALRPRRLLHDW